MKQVLVKVEWKTHEMGGRSRLPSGDDEYLGVTIIGNSPVNNAWSIRIKWLDQESEEYLWYGLASFLVEAAPFDELQVGVSFPLTEGAKTVAIASVISSAKVIERIVASATAA